MNHETKTQINGISRDEFLENIGVAAVKLMVGLHALKRPSFVAYLTQELTSEPIVTDQFTIINTKNNCCRIEGFEPIVSTSPDDDTNFLISVVKGFQTDPYKDDLKPDLGDFYFIGLSSPFGKFHGYIQNNRGSKAGGGTEIEVRFIDIEPVCEPTSDFAHTN
jgi:hypothetical protein